MQRCYFSLEASRSVLAERFNRLLAHLQDRPTHRKSCSRCTSIIVYKFFERAPSRLTPASMRWHHKFVINADEYSIALHPLLWQQKTPSARAISVWLYSVRCSLLSNSLALGIRLADSVPDPPTSKLLTAIVSKPHDIISDE